MESILTLIKKRVGIAEDDEHFDDDVLMEINTAIMTLTQLGVGPSEGFVVKDKTNTWSEFIKDGSIMEGVKTYIYLSVKLAFDPPTNSFVVESMERQKKELEWRLNVASEA